MDKYNDYYLSYKGLAYFWEQATFKSISRTTSTKAYCGQQADWSSHMEAVEKRGQCRLYFIRRLRSFNICKPLWCSFYETVVASALFFGVVRWGVRAHSSDRSRLNKLIIKKASTIVGVSQNWVQQVAEVRMLRKMNTIMNHNSHPHYALAVFLQSNVSLRLILTRSMTEHDRKSFLLAAIRLFNVQ